ncbi:hypothetical protein DFS33DRAFT_1272169 [Desarmillaria ectypa]|nr:hypothetical protein DFS33DRAFT_1272169 [Desarmillaria ectypa]
MDIDRDAALSTRNDVFELFYAWEQEDTRARILSLAVDADSDDDDEFDVSFENNAPISNADLEATGEMFTVLSYDEGGVPTLSGTISCIEIPVPKDFEPHPPYLVCTPASRSAEKETFDKMLSAESPPFIPFADDPTFLLAEYLTYYQSFEWQIDFVDPDVLPWLDEPVIMTLPPRRLPSENDLLNEVNRFRPQFCPNMNGINLAFEYPPINPVTSTKTNQSLKLQQGAPCGPDCYLHLDESHDGMMEGVQWTDPEDEGFLHGVLKLDPDISLCSLSVICRKRCFEMMTMLLIIYRYSSRNLTFVIAGSPRRRKCCDCTHAKKTKLCMNEKACICVAGGRECDPELCLGCDARKRPLSIGLETLNIKQHLEIKQSAYGLYWKGNEPDAEDEIED